MSSVSQCVYPKARIRSYKHDTKPFNYNYVDDTRDIVIILRGQFYYPIYSRYSSIRRGKVIYEHVYIIKLI